MKVIYRHISWSGSCKSISLLKSYIYRFGSWMGGDRDGNPFVTPETTRDVVITARLSAINLYFTSIEELMFELSNWRCSKEMRVSLRLQ